MLKKAKNLILSAAALLLTAELAGGVVALNQNFEKGFDVGALSEKQNIPGIKIYAHTGGLEIINDSSKVLKMGRLDAKSSIHFKLPANMPKNENFRLSFKIKMPKKNGTAIFIGTDQKNLIGGIGLSGGEIPMGYDRLDHWQKSNMPAIPADAWSKVAVDFNVATKSYDLAVTYPDGKVVTSPIEYPFLSDKMVEVWVVNSLPKNSYTLWDDIKLEFTGKPVEDANTTGILVDENFDNLPVGEIGMAGKYVGGKWINTSAMHSFSVVDSPAKSKPHAFKVLRHGPSGYFGFRPRTQIPRGHNFTFECDTYLPTGFGTVFHFNNAKGFVGGVLVVPDNPVKAYNINMGWVDNVKDLILPPKAWFHVKVNFNVNRGFYTVDITMPDGKVVKGVTEYPFLNPDPVTEWRFVNILPDGCHAYVDNVKIYFDTAISMEGRHNYAEKASSTDPAFNAMLKGKAAYIPDGKIVEVELNQAKFEALLLQAADGKKLPSKVALRAQNAGSRWIELGVFDVNANGLIKFDEVDQILKLQLRFPVENGTGLKAAGIYSAPATPQGELDRGWAKLFDAEYRLPVYDRAYPGFDVARLSFVNHANKPLKAVINLHDRLKNKPYKTIEYTIPAGTNDLNFDLKDVPDGEYVTTITSDSDFKGGKITRLLRVYTSPECTAVPQTEMTGEKIFFPDGFFLSSSSNIRYTTGVTRAIPVKIGSTKDDEYIVMASNVGINKDGKVAVNFRTINRMWMTDSTKTFHAVAEDDAMENWSYHDGYTSLTSKNVMAGPIPEAARSNWTPKKGPDGKIKYRFYDPEKDGPIKLNELHCKFISYATKGQVGYDDNNWGVMTPAAATVWTLWYKSPGEALIVGKNPLVAGFPVSGDLEPPNSGSDLSFGQWLSDDGKTLYFGFGRHLMRYEPYVAPYDNLHDRARIVGIWKTTDGINWEQGYVAPPDENKPVADQHYGGKAMRMPNGAGLYYCILNRYSALTQQISWEIIYSWDGFRWHRYLDQPQFRENGPFNSWCHGGGYLEQSAFEHNGKYYMLMSWTGNSYHFEAEVTHSSTLTIDHLTGDYMKKRYEPRQLHRWPYFKEYFNCDWEKLAEHARNSFSAIGILEFRKDGYFYAVADDQDAQIITRLISADNGMKLNAVVKESGYLKVTLLDENGNAIPGYAKEYGPMDETDKVVFEQLPKGKFQVKINAKNAEIYTLGF